MKSYKLASLNACQPAGQYRSQPLTRNVFTFYHLLFTIHNAPFTIHDAHIAYHTSL